MHTGKGDIQKDAAILFERGFPRVAFCLRHRAPDPEVAPALRISTLGRDRILSRVSASIEPMCSVAVVSIGAITLSPKTPIDGHSHLGTEAWKHK